MWREGEEGRKEKVGQGKMGEGMIVQTSKYPFKVFAEETEADRLEFRDFFEEKKTNQLPAKRL